MSETIPGPFAWPILGNMLDVTSEEGTTRALESLADIYGPVYQLTLRGQTSIVVSSAELLQRITDEKHFVKIPPLALDNGTGARGLFVARSEDPDWGQAHRILMPAFGPLPVENMFEEMRDIASQLCLKWARLGSENQILLTEDFTRLTLDTIALCAMDFRFNSFYQSEMHPFVGAMVKFLESAGRRSARPWLYNKIFSSSEAVKAHGDVGIMEKTAQYIIDRRRSNPSKRNDLLNTLLHGTDPKTGLAMRDELITANMIGFLIAGHETTSGLLSFTFMQLLKNPEAYLKAQQEVDNVVGEGPIQQEHMNKLHYLKGVLRETLRLTPTAPGLTKVIRSDQGSVPTTFCDGKYLVPPNMPIRVLLGKSMSDPTYFGDDAHEFEPERMMEDNPNFNHFMKAWKPFGNGSRSCIGQNFAWQEALLVTAMILQNFDIHFANDGYDLHITQTLTIKPKDLYTKVKLRKSLTPTDLSGRLYGSIETGDSNVNSVGSLSSDRVLGASTSARLTILHGSNSGTCHTLAQMLGADVANQLNVDASIQDLDSATDRLPRDHPIVIITASYEGNPPDNASRFFSWLENLPNSSLVGVKFSVFGCGNSEWQNTLHRIPRLVDKMLEEKGATRCFDLGLADVHRRSVKDDFSQWQTGFINELRGVVGIKNVLPRAKKPIQAEIYTEKRANSLSSGLTVAKVKDTRTLTNSKESEKRHMEIEMSSVCSYECGDYIGILPLNPDKLVKKVMAHWGLPWDSSIVLQSKLFASLPTGTPLSIYEILRGYVELSSEAAKRDLAQLQSYVENENTLSQLSNTIEDSAESEVMKRGPSLFEYLERYPEINMPFPAFLSCLVPLHIRQYSISSSPLSNPKSCTITYSVMKHTTTGDEDVREGVASTFLSTLRPGDSIQISLMRTATANKKCPFRLPVDNTTPILMFCAGTGLAPFRGFIQHRASMMEANKQLRLAPAILFVGCRSQSQDRLYADEFDKWHDMGAVDMRYAFSREPEESYGCKYISDRMLRDQDDIIQLWRQGARAYICGNRVILEAVRKATREIISSNLMGESEEKKQERMRKFDEQVAERVVSDIFD